jgi:hypothetical protein
LAEAPYICFADLLTKYILCLSINPLMRSITN